MQHLIDRLQSLQLGLNDAIEQAKTVEGIPDNYPIISENVLQLSFAVTLLLGALKPKELRSKSLNCPPPTPYPDHVLTADELTEEQKQFRQRMGI